MFHTLTDLLDAWHGLHLLAGINVAECRRFQTILSDPTTGIICDQTRLFSQFHPYRKSRGNVVYTMLHGLTLKTVLQVQAYARHGSQCALAGIR